MAHTKLKLCVVVAGVGWSLLLIYVMSSLNMGSDDMTDPHRRSAHFQQAENVPLARAAKSHVLLGELIEATKKLNKTGGGVGKTVQPPPPPLPPVPLNNHLANTNHTGKVNVVVSGDSASLLGVVAVMNSVATNTHTPTHFYITLPKDIIADFRTWVQRTKLRKTEYTVSPHPVQLPPGKPHFAKVYLHTIFPNLEGRFVYLPPDVIVQGDISDLATLTLKPDSLGAFAEDCHSAMRHRQGSSSRPLYASHLNLRHPKLRGRGIKPATCTFDTNVFVADTEIWRAANVTQQLSAWANTSASDHLYGADPEADASEAAMLIVMYQHISPLPLSWHLAGLGLSPGAGYSQSLVKAAKLLRWDGPFKPWGRRAAFSDVWFQYALPDPHRKYRPKRMFT